MNVYGRGGALQLDDNELSGAVSVNAVAPNRKTIIMPDSSPFFALQAADGGARAGTLFTPRGEVRTPLFMPVATQGSVKAVAPDDLRSVGASVVLGNTYHLYLRPGTALIERFGGLHRFMRWDGPTLTDSGGFQGFSLRNLRKMDEAGIAFKSHWDGSAHKLTPESAIAAQESIGADIIMPLDVCAPADSDRREVEAAAERTARWAERCKAAHTRDGDQTLFGIVQGGLHADLRRRSARQITALGFRGYALGGLSVGETKSEMYETTELGASMLPSDSPRYLMGVGSPEDLVESVARGIDMFDCALPTRVARNGALFSADGRVNIYAARYRERDEPPIADCDCYACATFSAAYLHHLFRAKELLAYRLASIHNLRFILKMMADMRDAIFAGRFESYRRDFHNRFVPTNQSARAEQRRKWLRSRDAKQG